MPFLSPAKLLIILVIALVVLGPDKLPRVAKQIGGLWRDFRRFREKLESEVRGNFPDLPSTDTITQVVRSPLSFLDGLAESDGSGNESTSGVQSVSEVQESEGAAIGSASALNRSTGTLHAYEPSPPNPGSLTSESADGGHQIRFNGVGGPEEPGMN